jgi:hypothetical protein
LYIDTKITIQDLSVPVDKFYADTRFGNNDPIVNQFNNFGRWIDGTKNNIELTAGLFNGLVRFRATGEFSSIALPDAHHSNIPRNGVNIYSFAIAPEEHQPSGTANFSTIKEVQLRIKLAANFKELVLWVFDTHYNIARVINGFAGLSY